MNELEGLSFVFSILDLYELTPCPWLASTDYDAQVSEYHCYGCEAVGYARWPHWEIEFTHGPDCKWQVARKLAAVADVSQSS